jgi:type I restriction enzyme M protein
VCLANPPYSIKQWDRDAFASDPWGRNIYGTPPQGRADYAFWQHIIQSLHPKTGRCAILFPHGVLFRNEERYMRQKLVEHDVIETVLGLGPNLFYNSPMEACVVVCRMKKSRSRKVKIQFINAVNEVSCERAQSFLTEAHIRRIVAAYQRDQDEPGFSRLVPMEEIKLQEHNLSIPLYVRSESGKGDRATAPGSSLAEAIESWQLSSRELRSSMESLLVTLKEVGGVE